MKDVFISYSRRNEAFTKKLFTRLEEAGRDAWIDWEGIPLSANWWREIQEGIEAADNFIFIATEESLSSQVCMLELYHAVQSGKRIIPVVREQPNFQSAMEKLEATALDEGMLERLEGRDLMEIARTNHQELRHLNWAFFRRDEDFEESFLNLILTVDTDLEYVKEHTWIYVQARNWEENRRQRDLLLYGEEIAEAEEWLKSSKDKKPPPTALHQKYIEQSRIVEDSRKRLLRNLRIASVVLGMIGVAAVLATIVALDQTSRASQRADEAQAEVASAELRLTAVSMEIEQGQQLIESQRLATLANGILLDPAGNVEVALLLGLRGLQEQYAWQTENALIQAMDRYHSLRMLTDETQIFVNAVEFLPNGLLALVVGNESAEKHVRLWDLQSGEINEQFFGHVSDITDIAISPDGKRYATASADRTVRVVDIETGERIHKFEDHEDFVTVVEFSPDGERLATGSADRTVRLRDMETGEEVHLLDAEAYVSSIAFSPDGSQVATGALDNTAKIWDVGTGELLHVLEDDVGSVMDVVYTPDGEGLILGDSVGNMMVWDVAEEEVLEVLSASNDGIRSIDLSPDGKHLVSAGTDGLARLWNLETGAMERLFSGHTDEITHAVFSPNGRYLVTGSEDGTFRLWDAFLNPPFLKLPDDVRSLVFSPDNHSVLVGSDDRNAYLFDVQTQDFRVLEGHTGYVTSTAFSEDGAMALTGARDNRAILWNTETGEVLQEFAGHLSKVTAVDFLSDEQVVTGGYDGTVRIWDINTGEQVGILPEDTVGRVDTVKVSPSGQYLLIGSRGFLAQVWDLVNAEFVGTFGDNDDFSVRVAMSPDESLIATAGDNGVLRLWQVDSGELWQEIGAHTNPVTSITFMPDGEHVLTTSEDNTARLWSTDTGKEVRRLTGHQDDVTHAGVAGDGQTIVTSSRDHTVRLWNATPEDFVRDVCNRLYRDLTAEERQEFGVDDLPTCDPEAIERDSLVEDVPPQFPASAPIAEAQDPEVIFDTEDDPAPDPLDVFQTSDAILIDAEVDSAWEDVPTHPINNYLGGDVSSLEDAYGEFRILWDEDYLYLLVDVVDDKLVRDSGPAFWEDDGIELYFDMGFERASSYDENDHSPRVRWDDFFLYETNNQQIREDVDFVQRDIAGGYRVEMRFPWSAFDVTPEGDQSFGFDVHILDDDDASGRDVKLAWFADKSNDTAWQDPSAMGVAVLRDGVGE